MRDICITGLPGAGKGTLATNLQTLAESMNIETEVIVTGDIAREISKESRETGAFAPEDEMRRRITDRVDVARRAGAVVITEGFPRTPAQLVVAERLLHNPLYVIMETSALICIRRLIARGRADDTSDAIGRRIVEHKQIVGEVMDIVREGEQWEDWMSVPNNDLIHCQQIAIQAEW
jgi:adenylate kinase